MFLATLLNVKFSLICRYIFLINNDSKNYFSNFYMACLASYIPLDFPLSELLEMRIDKTITLKKHLPLIMR